MSVLDHPDKANVVVDTVSLMFIGSVAHVKDDIKELVCDVHRLARLDFKVVDYSKGGFMVNHSSELSFFVAVKSKKLLDPILMELKETVLGNLLRLSPKGEMVYLGTR